MDGRKEEQHFLQNNQYLHWDIDAIREKVSTLVKQYNLHQIPGVDPFDTLPMQLEPYMHDVLLYCKSF